MSHSGIVDSCVLSFFLGIKNVLEIKERMEEPHAYMVLLFRWGNMLF